MTLGKGVDVYHMDSSIKHRTSEIGTSERDILVIMTQSLVISFEMRYFFSGSSLLPAVLATTAVQPFLTQSGSKQSNHSKS